MSRVKHKLKRFKPFGSKSLIEKVKEIPLRSIFTEERMFTEHYSYKTKRYPEDAVKILKHMIRTCYMLRSQWFVMTGEQISEAINTWHAKELKLTNPISPSQIARIMTVLVEENFFFRQRVGSKKIKINGKRVINSAYLYKINFEKLCEFFNASPYLVDIIKTEIEKYFIDTVEKEEEKNEDISPVINIISPKALSYQIKKLRFYKKGKTCMQKGEVSRLVPQLPEIFRLSGVKEAHQKEVQRLFEHYHMQKKRYWCTVEGWIRAFRGWCYNFVQNFQEIAWTVLSKKTYIRPSPISQRILNDLSTESLGYVPRKIFPQTTPINHDNPYRMLN